LKTFLAFILCLFPNLTFAKPITASLMLFEKIPVSQLAENVTNPDSPRFHKFYSPDEIRDLVAPDNADYYELINALRKAGFSIIYRSTSNLVITIGADHKVFEKVFHTQIYFPGPGKYHRNTVEPQIPDNLSLISSISGLNNYRKISPLHKRFLGKISTNNKQAPGILPDQIKKAYNLTPIYQNGITGKGQHIAIATYGDFSIDDVQQYYGMVNLPSIPTIDKVTFNGVANYDADSATETELDAEFTGMIAPGASIHVFTSADNSDQGEVSVFTAILDDNRAKVVNYSWGSCEFFIRPTHKGDMDKVFARAIAQGVNIFVASGDSGSDGCANGGIVADWPASHPFVVAVGGTSLYLNLDGTKNETGWSGSGGGISSIYSLPPYQLSFKTPFNKRSVPDVSFNADPATGEAIWVRSALNASPTWVQIGGTSMAAPQWAGFLALVNEARLKKSLSPIGFINYEIYRSPKSSYDIVSGSNGAYNATIGWDAVTGWGSIRGSEMLNYLSSI
jgi:kumamolisin